MNVVIPDSIEPIIGWKAWSLEETDDGWRLLSPSVNSQWEPGEPLDADSHFENLVFTWEPDRDPDAGFPLSEVDIFEVLPEKPELELPSGLYWILRQKYSKHQSPKEQCSCGIHIAKTRSHAYKYGPIIGRCYGWGIVCEHDLGWRVQYAYPAEIHISDESQIQALSAYGVPLIWEDEVRENPLRMWKKHWLSSLFTVGMVFLLGASTVASISLLIRLASSI